MNQKYLRANQGRFMTKDLHKAIMKLGISFYMIGQIFSEKNTKTKEIFVLASWKKLKKIILQILI